MQRTSILGAVSWALGLTLLAYVGFLIHEILSAGTQKATGLGVFPKILYDPWFCSTTILRFVVVFLWRLR